MTRPISFFTLTTLMNRIVFAGLLLSMFAITGAYAFADTHHDWRHDAIRYQGLTRAHWSDREVILTIRAAVDHWPVPGGVSKALAVASCESGLNERASNGGSYLGLFQQAARYWPARQNLYDSRRWNLRESAFNARANVVVSIRMAHSGGWSGWGCA